MKKLTMKFGFISGPRDMEAYLEAGRYLFSMGYIPLNQFSVNADNKCLTTREKRMEKIKCCDLIFMLEGWEDCPDAVDEYEEAVFWNKEHKDNKKGISLPEYRE